MPIHFKDRNMTDRALADAGLGPTVDASIQLADDMNAFRPRLSLDHEIAVWKTYDDDGPIAARRLLTTIKEIKSPTLLRQKASQPGMVTVQLPMSLARALSAARANEGDTKVEQALNYIAGPGPQVSVGGTLTDSGDGSKMPSKAKTYDPNRDPLAIAMGADQLKGR